MAQTLRIQRRPLLQLKALLGKKIILMTMPIEAYPFRWRAVSLILQSLWSLRTFKHGSFLVAYFLGQMKKLEKHLESVHALWLYVLLL